MKSLTILLFCTLLVFAACERGAQDTTVAPNNKEQKMESIYDFVMKDIDGNEVKMEKFRGKALLIVNVASECGYTPQYTGLQKIYQDYQGKEFAVLGFPANDFGKQEPGSNEEIKTFCSKNHQVTFPMFAKISVKGNDKHPFYKFLTAQAKENDPKFAGEITWNFNKILVDKTGKVVSYFPSKKKPEDPEVIAAIEKAL